MESYTALTGFDAGCHVFVLFGFLVPARKITHYEALRIYSCLTNVEWSVFKRRATIPKFLPYRECPR